MSHWTKMFASTTAWPMTTQHGLIGLWGGPTNSGVRVSPETAMRLSTVFACVRLLSETIAALPLVVYQRQTDGGRMEATNHPLYDLLHDRPNDQQTAIEWRQQMTAHALLRGNGYSLIVPGDRGFADQLVPQHPDEVYPEQLADGSLRYRIGGKVYTNDEVYHLRGLSMDGKTGMSVVAYARESMGLDLAAEAYGGRYFANGAEPRGVLQKTDGKSLSDKAAGRISSSWEAAHSGSNQHKVAVLEEGLEYKAVGLSNRDSQFLELREFQAEDECRWFGVPPHMVGLTSKATSWGSGIEQMGIGFVTYTLLPWLKRWEQSISRDLILAPKQYFIEHVVAGLLRGDMAARYTSYALGRVNGWLCTNDIRRLENLNPVPGGDTDFLRPLNMAPANSASAPGQGAHYDQLVGDAAARIAHKEVTALAKFSKRAAESASAPAWPAAVEEFYSDHAAFVAQTMRIPIERAQAYTAWCKRELVADGQAALQDWELRRVGELIHLTRAPIVEAA